MSAEQLKSQLAASTEAHQQHQQEVLMYSCAKCRAPLFSSLQLMTHDPNAEHKQFQKNKHSYSGKGNACTSVFVNYEKVEWVKDESDRKKQQEEEEKKKNREVGGEEEDDDEWSKYEQQYSQFSKKSEADDEKDLLCPNMRCKAKLGSKQWQGTQCSCGAWVTPAFKVLLSKIDGIPAQVLTQQQQNAATSGFQ